MRCVLLLALLASVAVSAEPTESTYFAREAEIGELIAATAKPYSSRSLAELRTLSPIISETSQQYKHDNFTSDDGVRWHTLTFDGLVIDGFGGKYTPFYIVRIKILSGSWPMARNLKVGLSAAHLFKHWGQPTSTDENLIRYVGETESAEFTMRDGHIAEVSLRLYVD